jgi:hypothetical protein
MLQSLDDKPHDILWRQLGAWPRQFRGCPGLLNLRRRRRRLDDWIFALREHGAQQHENAQRDKDADHRPALVVCFIHGSNVVGVVGLYKLDTVVKDLTLTEGIDNG